MNIPAVPSRFLHMYNYILLRNVVCKQSCMRLIWVNVRPFGRRWVLKYHLMTFFSQPLFAQGAAPSQQVKSCLEGLLKDPRNTIVILSGRDKSLLEEWFGEIKGQWKRPLITSHSFFVCCSLYGGPTESIRDCVNGRCFVFGLPTCGI